MNDIEHEHDHLDELDANEPPKSVSGITLTEEQQHAVELIIQWMKDDLGPREFKLGGYAGTGKTTIIKHIIAELSKQYRIITCAFTGKACSVLRRKGVHADTIHSNIYDFDIDQKTGEISFFKKYYFAPDLVIVDEASMISSDLYKDLLSFNKKYLFVGDPGQLEPVGDNPNLMLKPDFVLSKIHRQAEQSPIITLANSVRTGGTITHRELAGLNIRKKVMDSALALSCDQIICAKNKTRTDFNKAIRTIKGYTGEIVEGEKIIILRNNKNFNVFNGMILSIKKIVQLNAKSRKTWTPVFVVDCEDELGNTFAKLPIWQVPFQRELVKGEYPKSDAIHADYGYVITCHKSQGSEWDKVFVWDEWMPPQVWDMKRWRYTAITRAAKELIYNI